MTREELYKRFGPMLIEAIVMIMKDEINLIRVEVALPERTNEQLLNAISSKLESLEKYDWLQEG